MKYKIYTPNTNFNEFRFGLKFTKGFAETTEKEIADKCRNASYKVVEEKIVKRGVKKNEKL